MRINVVSAGQLSAEQEAAWAKLQRADQTVDNPCFRPEFTKAVAAVRSDVEVAVIEEDNRFLGFLPFQRDRHGIGRPVGSVLSDMHGAIMAKGLEWDAEQLVRESGLVAWHFDHLVASQEPFQPFHECVEDSPYLDLCEGYPAYLAERRAVGCSTLNQARRKARKLERDVGPLRFVTHTNDPAEFETLIRWKREHVLRTNCLDFFRSAWVIDLLELVRTTQTEAFAGLLSALYAGDELVAVLLGMRSYDVISSWIPTYNPKFGKYSPGVLLHLELAKSAAELGVRRIDLGRGENRMKASLGSGAFPVAIGCVDQRPLNRLLRKGWHQLRGIANSSRLARTPLKAYRRVRNWMTCDLDRPRRPGHIGTATRRGSKQRVDSERYE